GPAAIHPGTDPLPLLATQQGAAASQGAFGSLFEEPNSFAGDIDCTARGFNPTGTAPTNCKPAAMALAVLPNGQELYWDGLEGMNQIPLNTVGQFGAVARNDQSRVMSITANGVTWAKPTPVTGGTNPNSGAGDYLPLVPHVTDPLGSSDLFCSSLVLLDNGDLMTAGGTDYYLEPGVPGGVAGQPVGLSELEGLRVTRLFNPANNAWTFSGNMQYGRWYPSLVTLPNGNVFVASGVTKLIKPVYPNNLMGSGTNVKQTETYNPVTGTWTYNGASADQSLPLFPRLHLLPDGTIYYDAAGQTFNPDGQSYDEALWNMASDYNPVTKTWRSLGVPVIGGLPLGFRGSGFSVMLPLQPNATGAYTNAQFLSAGGVIGTTPGTYLATNTSTLDTVNTAAGDAFSSVATGNLVNARWYSTGVVLPDGEVFAVNGANRDEVVAPGSGNPVVQGELYDPATQTWQAAATESHGRTYHNTAVLLPDGSVLVGGHAPIATGYAFQDNAGHTLIGLSKAESDPSFQIYYPPYFFYGVPRPVITGVLQQLAYTTTLTVSTPDAARVDTVELVRNTALTHLVDGDQRTVQLRILSQSGDQLTVAVPGPDVLPPGPYLLFINAASPKGQVPSVARQVFIGMAVPSYARTADGMAPPEQTTISAPAASIGSASTSASASTHTSAARQVGANPARSGAPAAEPASARLTKTALDAPVGNAVDLFALGASLAAAAGIALAVRRGWARRKVS
ncbi:MAG: galactose oxidase-like domain-containing protein, partial [Mycobacteriales bacterium]